MSNPQRLLDRQLKSFTLQELLVVLVIVGALVLLALPNLMPLITKAKSTEAKLQLEHVHTLQKNYFYEYSKYATNLSDIGFEQEMLSTDGEEGRANYRVEIVEASVSSFIARATAVVDFDGDGQLNVWKIDHKKSLKETVKD